MLAMSAKTGGGWGGPAEWDEWEEHGRALWEKEHGPMWSSEDWSKAWDKLRQNLERVLGDVPYVAVLERHRKGNYHLHLAWVGRVNLNVMRPLWWAICGGRGAGNVDAQYIKVRQGGDRAHRIASYISKYVGKHFTDNPRFNKKRYRASRQSLEEVRRYVLRAGMQQGGD